MSAVGTGAPVPSTGRLRRALAAALLVALLGGSLLAACGVTSQSDATRIEPGDVPFGLLEDQPTTTEVEAGKTATIYLLTADRLVGVDRSVPADATLEDLLGQVITGPTEVEQTLGITTAVPSGTLASVDTSRGIAEVDLAAAFGDIRSREQILALGNRLASDAAQGTSDLFGGGSGGKGLDLRPQKTWTPMEKLQHEFDAVGFFLSGHPLDAYGSIMNKLGVITYAQMEAKAERGNIAARVAGIVVSVRERRSQKGNKFAFAMFSDSTGQFESIIFSDVLNAAFVLQIRGQTAVSKAF